MTVNNSFQNKYPMASCYSQLAAAQERALTLKQAAIQAQTIQQQITAEQQAQAKKDTFIYKAKAEAKELVSSTFNPLGLIFAGIGLGGTLTTGHVQQVAEKCGKVWSGEKILGFIPKLKFNDIADAKPINIPEQLKNFNLKEVVSEVTTQEWKAGAYKSLAKSLPKSEEAVGVIAQLGKVSPDNAKEVNKIVQAVTQYGDADNLKNWSTLKKLNPFKWIGKGYRNACGGNMFMRSIPIAAMGLSLAFEGINIFMASKFGGKEVAKQSVRSVANAAASTTSATVGTAVFTKLGAIAGSAICPGAGTLIGGVIGGLFGGTIGYLGAAKVVNKTCDWTIGKQAWVKQEEAQKEQEKAEKAQLVELLGQKAQEFSQAATEAENEVQQLQFATNSQ